MNVVILIDSSAQIGHDTFTAVQQLVAGSAGSVLSGILLSSQPYGYYTQIAVVTFDDQPRFVYSTWNNQMSIPQLQSDVLAEPFTGGGKTLQL